jgi:hypothetical protein
VTGWLPPTTRAALTGLLKRGFVTAIDRSDKEQRHRVRHRPAAIRALRAATGLCPPQKVVAPLHDEATLNRPSRHGITRQTSRDRADAPSQILRACGKRQTHAAHVDKPTSNLARSARIKKAELDEIAHSLGFDSRRPDEIDFL